MANAKPVANSVAANGAEDPVSPILITLTGSDSDGIVASFKIKKLPKNGTLFLDFAMTTPIVDDGIYASAGNALMLYFQPAADFNGDTNFKYTAIDDLGNRSSEAKATITVTPVNDAPVPLDVIAGGKEDKIVKVKLQATDADSKIASFTIVDLPANGVLCLNKDGTGVVSANDVIAAGTKLYFKPDADWNGSTDFLYRATDVEGALSTTTATANINVAAVNDRPVTDDVVASANSSTPKAAITLTGDDVDGTVVSFKLDSLPKNGTLYLDAGLTIKAKSGQVYAATAETLTLYFKPDASFSQDVSFKYRALDDTGQKDKSPGLATIVFDATPPAAPVITVFSDDTGTQDDGITGDTDLLLSGTAEANAVIEVFDGGLSLGTTTANGVGVWSLPTGVLSETTHSFTAKATDGAGNTSVASAAFDVTIDVTPPAAPVIASFFDDDGTPDDRITTDRTLIINGTAEPGLTIEVFDGATSLGTTLTDSLGNWTFNTESLADGVYSFTAKATDVAANTSGPSNLLTVLVDATAPDAPVVASFSNDTGTPGDGLTTDRELTLTGTAEPGVTVEVFDGAVSLGTASVNGLGHWSFDTATLDLGNHSFTAIATDAAGYTSAASSPLTVTVNTSVVYSLSHLTSALGFVIQGGDAGDNAGYSVSNAGDVNADGFQDLIVGAPTAANYGGEAYVIYGSATGFGIPDGSGRSVIYLSSLQSADGFSLRGLPSIFGFLADLAGSSLSGAFDVNGDGFDDLIVGAPASDHAYVVFGGPDNYGTIDEDGREGFLLPGISDEDGFVIEGPNDSRLGVSVSAGDFNGDGFDDLLVGASAPTAFGGGLYPGDGKAYVIFGTASGFDLSDGGFGATLDVSSMSSGSGFVINGATTGDLTGNAVSTAGDINGDGIVDFVVGAPESGGGAGCAFVFFGKSSGFGASFDLANFQAADGFIIRGAPDAEVGRSISAAGDVNGDGYKDLIVGGNGEAYLIFGRSTGFGSLDANGRAIIDLSTLDPADGFIIQGANMLGFSVSSAGDINGDGFADLIVGNGAREPTYVVFGSAAAPGNIVGGRQIVDVDSLAPDEGFVIRPDHPFDFSGWSVSTAGDINNDGFDDLIVGAIGPADETEPGAAYVLFGGAFGASNTPIVRNGSAADEILMGGIGDDNLAGNGGVDVFHAGAGDDTITVPDLGFRLVDGGLGTDTLRFTGAGQTFDFSTLPGTRIEGIEAIDFTGSGNNTLTLRAGDVLQLSDTPNEDFTAASSHNSLVVLGDLGDQLNLIGFDPDGAGGNPPVSSWALQSSDVNLDGSAGGIYDIYDLIDGATHIASVAVHNDVIVDITQNAAFMV